jgi:hypothetical protein
VDTHHAQNFIKQWIALFFCGIRISPTVILEWNGVYAQKVLGVDFKYFPRSFTRSSMERIFSCGLHSSLKVMDEALEIKAKSDTKKRARMLDAEKQ